MQDLQADLDRRVGCVNGIRNETVLFGLVLIGELCVIDACRLQVRGDTAGNDHPDPALCPFGEIGGHALEAVFFLFEPRMHGPHNRAVL